MENIQHYVLFPNHDNGMRLYRELKKMGLKATIAPTPRAASTADTSFHRLAGISAVKFSFMTNGLDDT